MNDLIQRALGSAAIPSRLQPPGLSRLDGKQPDGLTLFPWKESKEIVWDFTFRDSLCPSYVLQTSKEAATIAEKGKHDN